MKQNNSRIILTALFLLLIMMLIGDFKTGKFSHENVQEYNIKLEIVFGIIILALIVFVVVKQKDNIRSAAGIVISLLAIYLGLFMLIKFTGDINFVMAVISFSFGFMALIWTIRAKKALSKGSSLRDFTSIFSNCLIFLFGIAIVDGMISLFNLNDVFFYIKYILLSITYILFVYASYKIAIIGKEFGFASQTTRIKKAIKKR